METIFIIDSDIEIVRYKEPDDIFVTLGFGWRIYSDKIYLEIAVGTLRKLETDDFLICILLVLWSVYSYA